MKRRLGLLVSLTGSIPLVLTGCTTSVFANRSKEVNEIVPESITIDGPATVYFGAGDVKYDVIVQPEEASKDVTWISSDETIMTINSLGKATPKKTGDVVITATSKLSTEVSASLNISVVDAPIPTSIEIDGPTEVVLHKEPSYRYTAIVAPEHAKIDVDWTIDDEQIAEIKQNGDLVPKKAGTVIIHAESIYDRSVYDDCQVVIIPEAPKSLLIEGNDGIKTQQTTQLTAVAEPEGSCKDVFWSTNDESLATISADGVLQTHDKEGTVIVTAKSKADETIIATKEILINNQIILVNFAPTIGKGFDWQGHTYGRLGESCQIKFTSRIYKENNEWLIIHKELKPTDIEIMFQGQNIMNKCSLEHNVLTIPIEESYPLSENITINILGAEINDWVQWNDIAKITKKDYEDFGRPGIHNAAKYFQVGDYKKGYVSGKLVGEYVIVDEYHDYYRTQDHSQWVDVPIALTFMPKVLHVEPKVRNNMPESQWEIKVEECETMNHIESEVVYGSEKKDEEEGEVIPTNFIRRELLTYKLDGLGNESLVAPMKPFTPMSKDGVPYVDNDVFWIPSYDEVYNSDQKFRYENRAIEITSKTTIPNYVDEGTLYSYFDPEKYAFFNNGRPRIPDPDLVYDDGYVDTPIWLRTAWTTFPDRSTEYGVATPGGIYARGATRFITWKSSDPDFDEVRTRYPNTMHKQVAEVKYKYGAAFCF